MNILVTGGAGYIGSHTCIKLISAGYTPIIIDNLCNSKEIVVSRIEEISGKITHFYKGDIRDKSLLNEIFIKHKIEAVIHFAGLKSVSESINIPLTYYDNNIYGLLCLAEVMDKHQIYNLIFSSSATVYGNINVPPFIETMETGGTTNPYGTSKLMSEKICQDLYIANNCWNITLLRYFNPAGAHLSGLIGEDPKGIPNNLIPYVSKVASGELEFLSVYGDDYPTKDGTGVRDYIHVEDLAEGHVSSLQNIGKSGVHIYNLGSGKGCSVLDIINLYEKVCGKKLNYKIKPRRSGDVPACWANVDKAKNELDWQTKFSLEDIIRDSWNWQLKQNYNGS